MACFNKREVSGVMVYISYTSNIDFDNVLRNTIENFTFQPMLGISNLASNNNKFFIKLSKRKNESSKSLVGEETGRKNIVGRG